MGWGKIRILGPLLLWGLAATLQNTASATEALPELSKCAQALTQIAPFQERVQIVKQALQEAWSKETSASPDQWTPENPALGQCAVSSLVLQDLLGGELVWAQAKLPDGSTDSHYKNRIGDQEIDLTVSQFPEGTEIPMGVEKRKEFASTRSYVLSFEATQRRYELLRERVLQILKNLGLSPKP